MEVSGYWSSERRCKYLGRMRQVQLNTELVGRGFKPPALRLVTPPLIQALVDRREQRVIVIILAVNPEPSCRPTRLP